MPTQPPLVPPQHHPHHPVLPPVVSQLPPTTMSYTCCHFRVVAVLLVTVLTAIFVVVICIITRRHKTRKSLDMQRLSSIIYRSTQSNVTFKDKQFYTGKNGKVPIHSANGTVDKDHSGEIRDAPRNYTALGPSESNDSVFQGAAEEPVAEGAISRPTSQASIRSNEVSSNPTLEMVAQAHPSMLDHPYDSCNWKTPW